MKRKPSLFMDGQIERKQCNGCRENGRARFRRSYKANPKKIIDQIVARRKLLPLEQLRAIKRAAKSRYFSRYPHKRREAGKRYRSRNKGKMLAYARARTLRQAQAMPPWADVAAIEKIYTLAAQLRAEGHDVQVDHVVPLKGKDRCGLHVPDNLRIRSSPYNLKKSNKVLPDRN